MTLTVGGSLAAQQPAFGPLTAEEGAPLHRVTFAPMMESADVGEPGTLATDVWLGLSNIFEQDSTETHDLFVDMERLLTAVTVRWGVADDLEVGGRLTLETAGRGVLDPVVLWYHDLLGFGQANRDRFPGDAYVERLGDGDRLFIEDAGPRALGLDDARIFLKWRAASSSDGRSVLSLKTVAWLPARTNRVGDRSANVGLVGLARLGVGAWYLHGMLGASTTRTSPELTTIVRAASFSFSVALERSFGSALAGVFQYQIAPPVLRGFGHRELDGVASNVVFGLAGRWGEGWSWDVGFQEDVPADTPAIDFTLGVRVSRSWQ